MKFRGHESFFIRKGWLHKGLKHVRNDDRIFIAKDRNPTQVLGIGTNMVKSLQYWMQAVGLAEELRENNVTVQRLTNFANIVWEYDKYLEEEGTIWLIHYNLATNNDLATTWYWFYNEFNVKEFTKDDFVNSLNGYVRYNLEGQVALSSLEDDFACLINTYIPRRKTHPERVSPENTIDSPLGVLGLIDIIDSKAKIYRKINLKKDSIDPLILLAVIVDQYNKNGASMSREIKISSLLNDPCNIGKVFLLDLNTINYYLDILQEMGLIKVIRTAGLDVVKLTTDLSYDELLIEYYKGLNTVGLRGEND